jgi:hypothetical protein
MLPANTGPEPIVIRKVIDASADEISDAIAAFADANGLESDPRVSGRVLLVPRDNAESDLFRRGDTIEVSVDASGPDTVVTLGATMAGLHARGSAWQRGRYIRGGIVSALFIAAGVGGITHGFNAGDLFPIAIGVGIGSRSVRRARAEYDSRDDYERQVARALNAVFDDLD